MSSLLSRLFSGRQRRQHTTRTRYLQLFEREIESGLAELTKDITEQWFKKIDEELKQTLPALLDNSLKSSLSELVGSSARTSNQSQPWEGALSRSLERFLVDLAGDLFNKKRVTVTQAESDRSRENSAQLRLSRGQQQAIAAREVGKGQRNL